MSAERVARLGLLACLLVIPACGGGGGGSGGDANSVPAASTASLPLQEGGLAVGGDVQSRATDVVSGGLTEEQVRHLEEVCRDVAEITPATDKPCPGIIPRKLPPCGPPLLYCLKVRAYGDVDQDVLGDGGYVEVVEERPGRPRCGSDPAGVCLRVGARTEETLDRVVEEGGVPTTPSPSPTPTSSGIGTTTPSDPSIGGGEESSPASPSGTR